MTIAKQYVKHDGIVVPEIQGAKGGKGGGKISPNSLFSSDFLFLTTAIGEGPVYRINPNGPQDIQIQDSSIDDLLKLDGDGSVDSKNFKTEHTTGTVTQAPIPIFGDAIVTPQGFASAVSLRSGPPSTATGDDITKYSPKSSIISQPTSAYPWDSLRFLFSIDQLSRTDSKGNVSGYSLTIAISIYKSDGVTLLTDDPIAISIRGKTDKPVRRSFEVVIPPEKQDPEGYVFTVEKTSQDSKDSKIQDSISMLGWFEVENKKQAYPRTAIVGYGLKAVNEHTGGIPTFTSMAKGLLVKVPSNYNQPVLSRLAITNVSPVKYAERAGEIDWREVELPHVATFTKINNSDVNYSYTSKGYSLQRPGAGTQLTEPNPQIYVGTWDGTFVYSWTQNPVWIIYDILTNSTYGLGIPPENIDKYKFYQVAQYCDACDPITGRFIGVDGLADGSYRYKPRGLYNKVRETLKGLPEGARIKERRFISDISIVDQEKSMDLLNKIASTFRGILIYSASKITLAVDMPDEYPVMMFNEATIKTGTFQISGSKESDVYTGIDVNYIDPTNHFKRETVRVNTADSNDGTEVSDIENIASLDLFGVTRRSQAVRMAQYQIAASKYQRRNVSFTTSSDAISLAPGDVISIASRSSGVAYGYGGKVRLDSAIAIANNTDVSLEHFTVPAITPEVFTQNTYPITLRILSQSSDRLETYIVSNVDFNLATSTSGSSGVDLATVKVLSKFNKNSKTFVNIADSGFTANIAPVAGDLWSLGEIQNPLNYYSDKSAKLFKVTNVKRESNSEEITVSGIEYISNVYIDSDTFINYEPTAYIDTTSAFSTPPSPNFTVTAVPRATLDGSIVVDGLLETTTQRAGYSQKFETEYYVSTPSATSMITDIVSASPLTLKAANSTALSIGVDSPQSILSGKNGFTTSAGSIKLLCNTVSAALGGIQLTVEGLSSCQDLNYAQHVLDVPTTTTGSIKTIIPIQSKNDSSEVLENFVGYSPTYTEYAKDVTYSAGTNILNIADEFILGNKLSDLLPAAPFYITINQSLNPSNYSNNSFYVTGTEYTYLKTGTLNKSATNYIDLDIKPRHANFVKFYVDGIRNSSITININKTLSIPANVVYASQSSDSTYRLEVDYYTVPTIEVGDTLEVSAGNVFIVSNTSYDVESAKYNAAITSNSIYRVELVDSPNFSLNGYNFINTSPNPVGTVRNISNNTFTLDYDVTAYPGNFRLANNDVYTLELDSTFTRRFLSEDGKIPELSLGTTSIRARNKNTIGRYSPYVQKSIFVSAIPIQRVLNLQLSESIYIEQTGGAAVRVTVLFDVIKNQQVTDYEISYRVESSELTSTSTGIALTDYNTVKVSAEGQDSTGKIRYSINNVNRGSSSGSSNITVRVTPLNRGIRGITTTASKSIVGKTEPPLNIINFTGGQQNEVVTLLWSYPTVNIGTSVQPADLDLAEVEIRKFPGIVSYTLENFLKANPLVTVSAGSVRKSVPIDSYGDFTYLAVTRDTSGNISTTVVGTQLSLTRAQRSTTVAAYNEDDPTERFTSIENNNSTEPNFPSYSVSTNQGLNYFNSNMVDNANGSSSGWSAASGITDLRAVESATYVTQIRDFGQTVTGNINILTRATQEIEQTYNDQHFILLESVSDTNTIANVLVDSDFGGIGSYLGFNNPSVFQPRYDNTNKTWVSGGTSGNVYAIWNHGQFVGDTANLNSYALIAGLINANAIALGETFYANGISTGSNSFANVTTKNSSYSLVDLKQFSDISSTYVGTLGTVTTQTFVRTAVNNVYYDYATTGNANVNTLAFASSSDGYVPYEAGTKTFRYLQIKYVVTNSDPQNYDFTLDKFRYSIDKEQTTYSNTVVYSSSPMTVDYTSSKFLTRPVLSFTVLSQTNALANPAIVVTTAASNTSVSFKLVASNGTGEYPANNTATVMMTAIGV